VAVLRGLGGPLVFAQFHIQVRLIDVYSTADNFEPANIWEVWRRFWRYSQAYVGFDRFNHSKSVFIITENHHVAKTFRLTPIVFSFAPQWLPQFFFILESPPVVIIIKQLLTIPFSMNAIRVIVMIKWLWQLSPKITWLTTSNGFAC